MTTDSEVYVKIWKFDDSNKAVNENKNFWKITDVMYNGGKLSLENCIDNELKISSISAWKTRIVENYTGTNDVNDNKDCPE